MGRVFVALPVPPCFALVRAGKACSDCIKPSLCNLDAHVQGVSGMDVITFANGPEI